MLENLIVSAKVGQTQNLISQVVEILAENISDADTLKFISQMKTGNVFDAIFIGKTPEGKGILSLNKNRVIVELPKSIPLKKQSEQLTRVPLIKEQFIKVRVEKSWPKPTLKIILPQSHQDRQENPDTRTVLTHQAKSISRLSRGEGFSQTTKPTQHEVDAVITRILDLKSIIVNTDSRSLLVPVENSNSFNIGEKVKISFDKAENNQRPILINNHTTVTNTVNLKTIIPYISSRMPIVQLANLLIDEVLNSPVLQELNIKSDLVSRLQNTLNLLIPREGEIPSEERIRQQVESSGVKYEAKVRQALESGLPVHKELASDLKGLLLELYQSADKVWQSIKNPGPLSNFRQTIKFAIDNIELNQLSTQISKQENQALVIQIPNPLSSENKTIQLYIRKDTSNGEAGSNDKKNSHNVAFFLDLSVLGKIKVNAKIGKENMSVRIDVENDSIASYINDKASNFKEKMGDHNIETSVECCVKGQVKPLKDSLIEMLINQNTSLVNIKT
jgi:hypothetical protein